MLIDPEKFNINQSWNLVRVSFAIFAVSALGQFFAYLKQNALPPVIAAQSATTQTETKPDGATVKTETTSKVTIQQPEQPGK